MNRAPIPISVVVPVKNEEANLARCLTQLSHFDEVIVVDSSSTDRTPQIAQECGATYVNFEWNGRYPKKRNWLLLNYKLRNDWVLFLDADEIVSEAFCVAAEAASRAGTYTGYWLNYTNYFLRKPLRHGLAQRKLALFRVDAGLYEGIPEEGWSKLDMEIHEHPILRGALGEISERIDHNDDRGIGKFIDRHQDYALWEARRFHHLCLSDAAAWSALTPRQKFKYRSLSKWWYPWFYLIYSYVIRMGFLDGAAGFYYSLYKTWYFLSIRLLILEENLAAFTEESGRPARASHEPG